MIIKANTGRMCLRTDPDIEGSAEATIEATHEVILGLRFKKRNNVPDPEATPFENADAIWTLSSGGARTMGYALIAAAEEADR